MLVSRSACVVIRHLCMFISGTATQVIASVVLLKRPDIGLYASMFFDVPSNREYGIEAVNSCYAANNSRG